MLVPAVQLIDQTILNLEMLANAFDEGADQLVRSPAEEHEVAARCQQAYEAIRSTIQKLRAARPTQGTLDRQLVLATCANYDYL